MSEPTGVVLGNSFVMESTATSPKLENISEAAGELGRPFLMKSTETSPKVETMSEAIVEFGNEILMETTETDALPKPRKIAPLKKSRFQHENGKTTLSDHKTEEIPNTTPEPQPQEDVPKKITKKLKLERPKKGEPGYKPRPGDADFDPFVPYTPAPPRTPRQIVLLPPYQKWSTSRKIPPEERGNWKIRVSPGPPTPTPEPDEPKLFMTPTPPPASSSETLSDEDESESEVPLSIYEFFRGRCKVCKGVGCNEHDTEDEEEDDDDKDEGSIIYSVDGSEVGSAGLLRSFVITDLEDDSEDGEFGLDGSDDEDEDDEYSEGSWDSLEEELVGEEADGEGGVVD